MSHTIDLKSYKAEIISLFRDDNFSDSIVNTLVNKYNLWVAEHMIKSCLQQWEICKQNYTTISNTFFHAQIQILFYQVDLEDKNMLHVLQAEDFDIDDQILRKLCVQLDLQHYMMKAQ